MQYLDTAWVGVAVTLVMVAFVLLNIVRARGKEGGLYIRRIPGLNALDDAITNVDHQKHLTQLASSWSSGKIVASLKQTETALWQLDRNANTRLVIEYLLLTYPAARELLENQ